MKALRPTNIPFPSTGSFTRASTATYMEDGILKTAAINEPRWQDNNLFLEDTSTNYAKNSNNFLLNWSTDGLSTLTANAGIGPSGLNDATSWIRGANQYLYRSPSSESIPSDNDTVSIFVKANGHNLLRLSLFGPIPTTLAICDFDLSLKTKTDVLGTSGSIQEIGYGWFRLSVKTLDGTTPRLFELFMISAAAGTGFFVYGVQFEKENLTSYIPTTTSPVTRAADTITGAGLIYTSATDTRPLWSNATTYSVGQVIRYNNTVYESLQNTNLNKQPDANPTWWLNLGADNISAAFDGKVGTKTTSTDKLRMIIKPGTNIDSVGYIEATASTISTSAIDEDYNLVYSYKSGLDTSIIEDWYDYFFLDPLGDPLTQVVHQGINPLDPNLVIGVEMVRSGTVELGVFVTGQTTAIGKTQYGLRAGIVDYSKKEADEFGNITIVERPYSKRLEGDVYVNNYDLNKVQRFLYNVRATPILWIASDSEELAEVSNVYGFYKDFSTTIAYPDVSMCNLQIEGLV